LTIYRLGFLTSARKEWDKLNPTVREQFTKKLRERLNEPHIPSARLTDMPNCYKIKLRAAGYRLVYQVDDGLIRIVVVAIGRRERNSVYKIAATRLE
jgi:mRNA interferase RelE/StbE